MAKLFLEVLCFSRDEAGVTNIEYATMGALIAVVVVVTIMTIPEPLNAWFTAIANCLAHPSTCGAS